MRDLFWDLSISVMRTMSSVVSFLCCYCSYHGRVAIPCCGIPSVILVVVSFCISNTGYAHLRHNQRHLRSDSLLNTRRSDWWAASWSVVLVSEFWQSGRRAYGTKMAEAVAPVSLMASATLAKTGLPRCSEPAFLGFVPPTTFVPVCSCQCLAFVVRTAVVVGAYRTRLLVVRGS
jgi:hypothetical protein